MSLWNKTRPGARVGLSALAVAAVLGAGAAGLALTAWSGPVFAQEHGSGGGSGGQGPGPGSTGGGGSGGHEDGGHEDGGHEDGGHEDGGHEDGGHEDGSGGQGGSGGHGGSSGSGGHEGTGSGGQGQGGEPHGSQGQGAGGSPPWAAEGIPEVELGRLNVARSPDRVIDRAHAEALAQLPQMAAFYNLPLSGMIAELQGNWDNLAIIDSPLQNLALFRDALDGQIDLSAYGISNDRNTLMAVFLGVATDKAMPVTTETVQALSIILEMPLSPSEAAAIAAQAETIRQAVVIGHG